MTFDNTLQLFRPTMIRFLYSSILCEKPVPLRNAAHIAATYKRIPDGMTEAVRYLKPVWQVIGKVVDMELRRDRAPGKPLFMYLLDLN